MIQREIIKGVRVLCDRSEAWVEELTPIDLVAEQLDYSLSTTWKAYIRRVVEVRRLSPEEVAAGYKGSVTAPQFYTFTPPDTLTFDQQLIPHEAVTAGLVVKVVLSPLWNCVEIPDWMFSRWAQGIEARTLFKLKAMRGTPWYDPDGAALFLSEYNQTLGEAMGDTARSYTTGGGLHA